ncbi:MAG: response regulator transcription factor [Dehalococcoidia bacterium]
MEPDSALFIRDKEEKLKALIIEDNADVVEAVSLCLQLRWPDVELSTAIEGAKGIEMAESESVDIIILDLNLPDIDGFEVLKRIRSFSNVPIVILTVRGQEDDQAKGLEMGADDYIVKPFKLRDLVARVNAVLRRSRVSTVGVEQPSVVRGKLTLNLTTNEARLGGRKIKLTPTESKVLYVLMKNAGHTLNSAKISQEVWGKEYIRTNNVRTYIRRLRDKLNDSPPQIILSQRGEGYKFISPM